MEGFCRMCPECNGRACGNKIRDRVQKESAILQSETTTNGKKSVSIWIH